MTVQSPCISLGEDAARQALRGGSGDAALKEGDAKDQEAGIETMLHVRT